MIKDKYLRNLFAPRFPYDPKKTPFFYGWIIVIVSTIGIMMSVPGQTTGVGVFTDFLIDVLDLSRSQLSMAYMFGTITSGFILPASGRMFDRVGARVMIVCASFTLTLTLLGLSACDWVIVILNVQGDGFFSTSARFMLIFAGFFLLRYSGQGLVAMTSRAMLGKWFNRKRGMVSGISSVAASAFFAGAPILLNHFITLYDWRGAWLFLAILTFGMTLLGWLTFRDNPEECGLWMDGDATNPAIPQEGQDNFIIVKEFTLKEARSTFTFWVFNLGLSAFSLIVTAMTFHISSIGAESNLSREDTFKLFLPMAVMSVLMNFVFLALSDHIKLKYFLAFNMFWMVIGTYGVQSFEYTLSYWMVVVGFGISGGIFSPLVTLLWPKFYGRKHLGAISGYNMSCMVIASALGPFIFAQSHDWFGSYDVGIYSCMMIPAVLFVLSFFVVNPQTQEMAS
jgi:MFS family permease